MQDPKIRITRRGLSHRVRGFDVWIELVDEKNRRFFTAKPLEMREVKENELYLPDEKSALIISPESAQQLMDDLWDVGIRPTEGVGSAGSLAATQKHLADMRTIAFRKLQITELMK